MEVPLDPDAGDNFLGTLPEDSTPMSLMIPATVPSKAKKWLVYVYVTVEGETDNYGRAYYQFSSTEGGKTYNRFMNVAFFKDSLVNSMNFWIPANSSRKLNVELKNASAPVKQKHKRHPGSCGLAEHLRCSEGTSTGAIVIGYEM